MTCRDCPSPIGARNKSGRCRTCFNARLNACPVAAAKRREGIARRFAQPGQREAQAARLVASVARWQATPEGKAARKAHGERIAREVLHSPRVVAITNSPEVRARAGAKRTATVLAWCPLGWRDHYRDLVRNRVPAKDAKRMVLAEVKIATARYQRAVAAQRLGQSARA